MIDVRFPEEWTTSPVLDAAVLLMGELEPDSAPVTLVGVLLEDGTNLFALIHPAGQRLLRTTGSTGWAIEERFVGNPPRPEHRPGVDNLWRQALGHVVQAGREAQAELGSEGEDGPAHEAAREERARLFAERERRRRGAG